MFQLFTVECQQCKGQIVLDRESSDTSYWCNFTCLKGWLSARPRLAKEIIEKLDPERLKVPTPDMCWDGSDGSREARDEDG